MVCKISLKKLLYMYLIFKRSRSQSEQGSLDTAIDSASAKMFLDESTDATPSVKKSFP